MADDLFVTLLPEHIKRGLIKSITHDCICIAVKTAIKIKHNVDVSKIEIFDQSYIFINGRMFELPEAIGTLIGKFDRKEPIAPTTFTLKGFTHEFFTSTDDGRKGTA